MRLWHVGIVPRSSTIQPADRLPDHGYGPLGQVTHGVLTQCLSEDPPERPRLSIGMNSLPDPPFPMVAFIAQDQEPGAWEHCDKNLWTFLATAAESIRVSPTPPPEAFGPEHHRMQRMLRIDAYVLVWTAHTVRPFDSEAGQALTANLVDGYLHPGDLDASPAAIPTPAAWAVDRIGTALTMWPNGTGTETEPGIACVQQPSGDPVATALGELLAAQYDWTARAFGL